MVCQNGTAHLQARSLGEQDGVPPVKGIRMTQPRVGGLVHIVENEVISLRGVATNPVMVVQPRKPKKPKKLRKQPKLLLPKKKRRRRRGSPGS